MKFFPCSFSVLFFLLQPVGLVAEEPDYYRGWEELSLKFDNDSHIDEDDGYTNGVFLFLRSESAAAIEDLPLGESAGSLMSILPGLEAGVETDFKLHLSLSHRLHTPRSLTRRDPPIHNDHPYSSMGYAGLGVGRFRKDDFSAWTVHLGMIGPISQGEEIQRYVHKRIDVSIPKGWHHQIQNGLLVNIAHEYRRRLLSWTEERSGLGFDLLGGVELAAGTLTTNASVRTALRFGWNVPDDFHMNPSFMGDARIGVRRSESSAPASIYVIAGADLVGLAYAVHWDGRFGETLPVDRDFGHVRFHLGLQFEFDSFGGSASWVAPSIPWDDAYGRDWDSYVALHAWYRF